MHFVAVTNVSGLPMKTGHGFQRLLMDLLRPTEADRLGCWPSVTLHPGRSLWDCPKAYKMAPIWCHSNAKVGGKAEPATHLAWACNPPEGDDPQFGKAGLNAFSILCMPMILVGV